MIALLVEIYFVRWHSSLGRKESSREQANVVESVLQATFSRYRDHCLRLASSSNRKGHEVRTGSGSVAIPAEKFAWWLWLNSGEVLAIE